MRYLRRNSAALYASAFIFLLGVFFIFWSLRPVGSSAESAEHFEIVKGEGVSVIAAHLKSAGLIRSTLSFKTMLVLGGSAYKLKPGFYSLSPSSSSFDIMNMLVLGPEKEVSVTIPEGSSVYDIDDVLSTAGVIGRGELIAYADHHAVEGRLFPDTYRFYVGSSVDNVVDKFLKNFDERTASLGKDAHSTSTLILASLIEKEVPDLTDRKIVAGITLKRLKAGMPLQIDATICYIKRKLTPESDAGCYPLSSLDFAIDSPYNTYLYRGWPPGPIGNPGVLALQAALAPQSSKYWYYLSDPETQKTVFAVTLDEQSKNRALYLR